MCVLGGTPHFQTHPNIDIFRQQRRTCHVESCFYQCAVRAAWLMSDLRSSFRYGLPHRFWPSASETGIVPTRHEQHQRSARQREQAPLQQPQVGQKMESCTSCTSGTSCTPKSNRLSTFSISILRFWGIVVWYSLYTPKFELWLATCWACQGSSAREEMGETGGRSWSFKWRGIFFRKHPVPWKRKLGWLVMSHYILLWLWLFVIHIFEKTIIHTNKSIHKYENYQSSAVSPQSQCWCHPPFHFPFRIRPKWLPILRFLNPLTKNKKSPCQKSDYTAGPAGHTNDLTTYWMSLKSGTKRQILWGLC